MDWFLLCRWQLWHLGDGYEGIGSRLAEMEWMMVMRCCVADQGGAVIDSGERALCGYGVVKTVKDGG